VLRNARPVAFLTTADSELARSFYEGQLDLQLLGDDAFALVFELGATTLRIAKVEQFTPQPFTVLGWAVDDVEGTIRGLNARGVEFERIPGVEQDGLGIWTSPSGTGVAWFKDPDGNLLSISAPSPLRGG
jgi:catechol 2,3-dioxygenase-like lactoylglutathione lyase family enzyme